jgi:DNA-binding transcriptional LysR family regulator
LSQPAVSGQLRLLQDEFGEALYLREGRGVRLTPAGEQLALYAGRLRDTWRDARAYRDALREVDRGTLRIGASTTPASYLLPYLLAEFHRSHPNVVLDTTNGNTAEITALLPQLDIALIEGSPSDSLLPETAVHAWQEDEIVAIVPNGHPLAADGRAYVGLAELGAYPLVMRETGSGVRQVVEQAFAQAQTTMRVALEIAGVEGVKESVRAGIGVGFVSAMSMRYEGDALRRLSLAPEPLRRHFSILVPHAGAASRVTLRFLELCLNGIPK